MRTAWEGHYSIIDGDLLFLVWTVKYAEVLNDFIHSLLNPPVRSFVSHTTTPLSACFIGIQEAHEGLKIVGQDGWEENKLKSEEMNDSHSC